MIKKPDVYVKTIFERSFFRFRRIHETNAMRRADIVRTRRNQAQIHSMVAEVALLGNTLFIVKVNRIIGTNFDASLATGALLIIQNHNTIGPFGNGLFGTGLGTRRLIAVHAAIDSENKIQLSVDPGGSIF